MYIHVLVCNNYVSIIITLSLPPSPSLSHQVLDAYLVVKLHEAMFDMKEQLQVMEARVTNIAREKERLERTLQAKTQYIRVSS